MHLHRDLEHETRPSPRTVLRTDGAPVGSYHEPAKVQAKTGPSASRSQRRPVRLEQCCQSGRVQASAFVFHRHDRPSIRARATNKHNDPHASADRRVLDGIVEKIDHDTR